MKTVLFGLIIIIGACKTTSANLLQDSSDEIAQNFVAIVRRVMNGNQLPKFDYDSSSHAVEFKEGLESDRDLGAKLSVIRDKVDEAFYTQYIDPLLSMEERIFVLSTAENSGRYGDLTLDEVLVSLLWNLKFEVLFAKAGIDGVIGILNKIVPSDAENIVEQNKKLIRLVAKVVFAKPLLVKAAAAKLPKEKRELWAANSKEFLNFTGSLGSFQANPARETQLETMIKQIFIENSQSDSSFLISNFDSERSYVEFECYSLDWIEVKTIDRGMIKTEKSLGKGLRQVITFSRDQVDKQFLKCGSKNYVLETKSVDFKARSLPQQDSFDFKYPLTVSMNLSPIKESSSTLLTFASQLAFLTANGYEPKSISFSSNLKERASQAALNSQLLMPRWRPMDPNYIQENYREIFQSDVNLQEGNKGIHIAASKTVNGNTTTLNVFTSLVEYGDSSSLFNYDSLMQTFCGKQKNTPGEQTVILSSGFNHVENFALVYERFHKSALGESSLLALPFMANVTKGRPATDNSIMVGLFELEQNLRYLELLKKNPSLQAVKESMQRASGRFTPSLTLRFLDLTLLKYAQRKAKFSTDEYEAKRVEEFYSLSKVDLAMQCMSEHEEVVTGKSGGFETTLTEIETGKITHY